MPRIGRYELLRLLGRGGMAEVFLARRRGPGGVEKQLAVKRIRPERIGDPRFVEMFVTEARLSMAMAHKNIVQVFDFGRAGDELFLVMEYVDGVDLGTALASLRKAGQRLDPLLAAFIAMEACQALDYAHRSRDQHGGDSGVVHRDVTPRNVLLSAAGEIKLVDFGVAATVTDLGGKGRVRGTPAFMSPEQARDEAVDGRADVFSLGLVLWESLAGRRAYQGNEQSEILEAARSAEVPPLGEDLPEGLRDIVARATARDPDQRFTDARAMQIALDSFVISARAASEGEPPSHRIASWIREVKASQSSAHRDSSDLTPPSGQVVTFLEDGVDHLADSLGYSTRVTVAETTGETAGETSGDRSVDDEPTPDGRDEPDAPTTTRRRWLIGCLGVAIASGLVFWGLQERSNPELQATPAPPAASIAPDGGVESATAVSDARATVSPIADAGAHNIALEEQPALQPTHRNSDRGSQGDLCRPPSKTRPQRQRAQSRSARRHGRE